MKSLLAMLLLLLAVHSTLQSAFEWTMIRHNQFEDWRLLEEHSKASLYVTACAYAFVAAVAVGFVLVHRAFVLQSLLCLVLMGRTAWGVYGKYDAGSLDWGEDTLMGWIYHMGVAFVALGIAFVLSGIVRRRRRMA